MKSLNISIYPNPSRFQQALCLENKRYRLSLYLYGVYEWLIYYQASILSCAEVRGTQADRSRAVLEWGEVVGDVDKELLYCLAGVKRNRGISRTVSTTRDECAAICRRGLGVTKRGRVHYLRVYRYCTEIIRVRV